MPLRYAVVQEAIDSKVITTKLDRISVAIPPSDTNVLFTHVTEGLDFPMPKGGDINSYIIYIGFDPAGVQEPKKPKGKPARKIGAADGSAGRREAAGIPFLSIQNEVRATSRGARRRCS